MNKRIANSNNATFETNAKIKLIHGDFYERCNEIPNGSVDLILTDPPYNTLSDLHEWDTEIDLDWLETIYSNLLKPTGVVISFCNLELFFRMYTTFTNKLCFKHFHIWEKPIGMPINLSRPLPETEFIVVFKQKNTKTSALTWHPEALGIEGKPYVKKSNILESPTRKMKKSAIIINKTGLRYPRTILKAPGKCNLPKKERTKHPTQKPIILLKRLILAHSNENELVLDPFAGSASTLLAAHDTNRRAIGYELMAEYYAMAQARINAYTAQDELF